MDIYLVQERLFACSRSTPSERFVGYGLPPGRDVVSNANRPVGRTDQSNLGDNGLFLIVLSFFNLRNFMQSHRGKKPVNFSSFFNYSHICRFGSGIPAPSNNLQKLPTFYFLKPRFLSSFVQSHYTKIITERLQTVMVTLNLSGPKYHIGAIDQGTSSTRFLLFDESSKIVLSHSVPVFTESPKPGYSFLDIICHMTSIFLYF